MTQTEALKLALDALENHTAIKHPQQIHYRDKAINAIKEALTQPDPYTKGYADAMNWKTANHLEHLPAAQPEQEPVAWATRMGEYAHIHWGAKRPEYPMVYEAPLYTTPPQRTWVGLTDEEELQLAGMMDKSRHWLVAAVEAKLKDKNT